MISKQATNSNQIFRRIITFSTTVKLKIELKGIWFATKFNPSVINIVSTLKDSSGSLVQPCSPTALTSSLKNLHLLRASKRNMA